LMANPAASYGDASALKTGPCHPAADPIEQRGTSPRISDSLLLPAAHRLSLELVR